MADKAIQDLDRIEKLEIGDLLLAGDASNGYNAYAMTGAVLRSFVEEQAGEIVGSAAADAQAAKDAAQQAAQSAQTASDAAASIGDSVANAAQSAQTAQEAAQTAESAIAQVNESAQQAAQSAENASASAQTAKDASESAQGSKTAAEQSASQAASSASQSASSAESASASKTAAAASAETAMQYSGNPPIIQSGTWWVWNAETQMYEDTAKPAQGEKGETGTAATITVESVVTGEPNTPAMVENVGTISEASFRFTIPQGEKGETGQTGKGLTILGYYESLGALQSAHPTAQPGDAYGVGTAEPYDIYIWDGVANAWKDNGRLQGAQGDAGKAATIIVGTVSTGEPGTQASVTNSGNENAAILNFVIPRGEDGQQGVDGQPGQDGAPGADGFSPVATVTQTETGAIVTVTDKTGTTTATLTNGKDGAPGEKGEPGQDGARGTPGEDATINGVNVLTLNATGGLTGQQSGNTYTIDGSGVLTSAKQYTDSVVGNINTLLDQINGEVI